VYARQVRYELQRTIDGVERELAEDAVRREILGISDGYDKQQRDLAAQMRSAVPPGPAFRLFFSRARSHPVFSVSVSIPVAVSVSVSVYVLVSVSVSVLISFVASVSLCLFLCLYRSLCLIFSVSRVHSLCLSVSASVSLCLTQTHMRSSESNISLSHTYSLACLL